MPFALGLRSAISAKALRPNRISSIHPRALVMAVSTGATSQSDSLLLLDPGMGQGLGEASDREVRRRGAIDDRRNDARRKEGKGGEQADVPFALPLPLGNLGERANAAEPDVVDPSPGLGDCDEQSIAAFGPHCRFCAGRMTAAKLGAVQGSVIVVGG